MLQRAKLQPQELNASASDGITPGEIFRAFRSLLRRQCWVILFPVGIALALAALYVATTPPSFTGLATLIIDSANVQLFAREPGGPTGGDVPPDTQVVDSQVEILGSDQIARAVIKQFRLTKDPEFVGPGAGLFGRAVKSALSLVHWFGYDLADADRSEEALMQRAVKSFAQQLSVSRVRLTSLIEVSFSADDPQRAADIANGLAYSYIKGQVDAKAEAAKKAGDWLQVRIHTLAEQTSAAERAVLEFKANHNIVTVESDAGTGERLLNEQRLAELSSQLVVTRTNLVDAKARLDRIEEIVKQGLTDATVSDATVTDTLHNDVVSKLRSQYLDLAAREHDLSARYGRDHQAAVNLRNQMGEIRGSIVAELQRLAETYKSDYQIAQQREASIEAELAGAVKDSRAVNQAQIELAGLQSKAQTYRAMHDNFVQRYMEAVQQESFPITEARLITPASPPLHKSSPNALVVFPIAGLVGLLIGLAIGQLREYLDRVFRTRAQVESKLLTDCIAVVPELAEAPVKATPAPAKKNVRESGARDLVGGQTLAWHVLKSPFSRFAEAMRSIKMAIDLKEGGRPNKVVAFTSTMPNEGKSTIAVSLAQLIAHAGASTILVDCDLRNPSLTRFLAPSATIGFFDIVNGDARLEDVVWIDQSTGLEFLPQAMKTRFAHADEALASEGALTLFDRLRERYDYVLVDCSPLTPVVDVKATSLFVNSYVYVIEWGHTQFDVVEFALDDAPGVYDRLVGAVLNRVDMKALARYDGFGAKYYFNKHYARYGYTD